MQAITCINAAYRYIAAGLLLSFILGPAVSLALYVAAADRQLAVSMFSLVLPEGRRLDLFISSVGLSAASAAACMAISWLSGLGLCMVCRTCPKTFKAFSIFLWFMALLPPFVHAFSWQAAFGLAGEFMSVDLTRGFFCGKMASWWVQTMAWLPLGVGVALIGFRGIEPDLIDAARMTAAPGAVLRQIVLPLTFPLAAAGGILVFALCLLDYSIPSLFQVSVYALEIFADYSLYNSSGRALMMSVPLILAGGSLVWTFYLMCKSVLSSGSLTGNYYKGQDLPPVYKILVAAALIILFVQIMLPVCLLALAASEWHAVFSSIKDSVAELMFTLQAAFFAGTAGAALSAGAAGLMLRGSAWLPALFACFSLSLPASLTGIGLIELFNTPLFGAFYNTDGMVAAAGVSRFGAIGLMIICLHLSRIDRLLFEAAELLQPPGWRRLLKIWLPLAAPGIAGAFMAVFMLSAGELGATLLVCPPGKTTLTVKIYNLLHYGASEAVAGLCLLLIAAGWAAGIAAAFLSERRNAGDQSC